jgi:hypothetical protein
MQKKMQKYRRRKIFKNIGAFKTLAPSKSLAGTKNLAHPKSLADAKNLAHGKILASTGPADGLVLLLGDVLNRVHVDSK